MLLILSFLFKVYSQDYFFNAYSNYGFVNLKLINVSINNSNKYLLAVDVFDKLSELIIYKCSSGNYINLEANLLKTKELEIQNNFYETNFICFDIFNNKVGIISNLEFLHLNDNNNNFKINLFPGFDLQIAQN